MSIPYNQIQSLKQPTLHCGKCDTAVFRLPSDVQLSDSVYDTIRRSEPIAPQPEPRNSNKTECATCGAFWGRPFNRYLTLKEGFYVQDHALSAR